MSFLLTVFLNLLLIGSMVAFVAFGALLALRTLEPLERLIRFGAMFAGALIVVGAKVGGLSFTEFILGALSETNPARGVAMVVGAAATGSAGVGLGWYLTSRAERSTNVAIRIMALVSVLAAAQFAEIYVSAFERNGLEIGAAAIPNLSFVVGLIMWFVLNFNANKPARRIPRLISRKGPSGDDTPGSGTGPGSQTNWLPPPPA